MGKKTKKIKEPETETETDDVSTEDVDTETDKSDKSDKSERKEKTLLSKFNKLSKKTKLYLGIFIVLLLAGIFMWYKNRKTLAKSNLQLNQPMESLNQNPQLQQIIPNNTITLPQVVQTQVIQPPNIQTQLSNPVSPQNIFS